MQLWLSLEAFLDILNEWHKAQWEKRLINNPHDATWLKEFPIPMLKCWSGLTLSIQASEYHYSHPRVNKGWPYGAFEVGYPSRMQPALRRYAEGPADLTGTVYPFVPLDILLLVISLHGGIDRAVRASERAKRKRMSKSERKSSLI